MARLEIRIPVSPTIGFFSQVALFSCALDRLGYAQDEVLLKVYVGAASDKDIHPVWQTPPGRAKIIWVDQEKVRRQSYYAQSDEVFLDPECGAPTMAFCDADTIWLRRIDPALEVVEARHPAIAGCNAHYPPQDARFRADPLGYWNELAQELAGRSVTLNHAYTIETETAAPFYVNFGFVLVTSTVFGAHGKRFIELKDAVASRLDQPWFAYQIALTLLIHELDLERVLLPVVFNYPNNKNFELVHPSAIADIRVLHYMRDEIFDRTKFCRNEATYQAFLLQPLEGVDAIFRDFVYELVGRFPPMAWRAPSLYYR
jgi:hypothetical protein